MIDRKGKNWVTELACSGHSRTNQLRVLKYGNIRIDKSLLTMDTFSNEY